MRLVVLVLVSVAFLPIIFGILFAVGLARLSSSSGREQAISVFWLIGALLFAG